MKGPSARARWTGLIAILALSILSGGWLLRRKAAPEGTVYQQARLFENVVASMKATSTRQPPRHWSLPCVTLMPSC